MDRSEKEYDADELYQLYNRLVENVEQLTLKAEEQLEKLKGFVVTDELASDISDVAKPYALILHENNWISEEQFRLFVEIDKKLEEMSKNEELWIEAALIESKEWDDCRNKGKKLLQILK